MPLPFLRLLLAAGALLLLPAAASAHAILLDSQPAAGATVKPGKVALVLRYNSRIDAARSAITLTGPDGKARPLRVAPGPTPATLAAEAELAAGAYLLRWQVLAIDGHITRGELRFTATP
jgi:methionine-rich copper-binding protein CopC